MKPSDKLKDVNILGLIIMMTELIGSTLQNLHIIIYKETPFFINYGFHLSMDELFLLPQMDTNFKYIKNVNTSFNHIKDDLLRSKELYKRHADKKRLEPPIFKEGDFVWVQTPPSLNIEDNSKLLPF